MCRPSNVQGWTDTGGGKKTSYTTTKGHHLAEDRAKRFEHVDLGQRRPAVMKDPQ